MIKKSDVHTNRYGVRIEDIKVGCVVLALGVDKYGKGIEDRFLIVAKDQIVIALMSCVKEKGKDIEKDCEIYNSMHYVRKNEYYKIHIKSIKRILSKLPKEQIKSFIPKKESIKMLVAPKKTERIEKKPVTAKKYKISKAKSSYGAFHMKYIPVNAYCKPYSGGDFR